MPFTLKKTVAPLLLTSFLLVALFGFAAMSHGSNGNMEGDCPFSNISASLCPQNILPNAPINLGTTTLRVTLFIIVSAAAAFSFHHIYRPLAFAPYSPPPLTSHDRKMRKWLSLVQHFPSR